MGRLFAVARKEVIQIRRDKRSLGMAFAVPAVLILVFGYVINFDVRDIRLAVLDRDATAQSRSLVDAFTASGYFRVVAHLGREAEAERRFHDRSARIALVIPPGFARDLAAGRPAQLQALVDGSDANTASIAMNYGAAIVNAWAAGTAPGGVALAAVQPVSRVWYNQELKSQHMVVPGLIAVIMMIIAGLLTALTIAREWERGTMEQLAATPVHRAEVILGKLLPYLGIGLVDVTVAVLLGVTVFGVPFRGNVVLLFGMSTLFLIGALCLGLVISAALKVQLFAMQVGLIATLLPSLLLSGLLYDIAAMPAPLRAISYLVPARYFVTVLRGIFLKGVGPQVLWAQGLGMILFALGGLTLAVRAFRKEIG
jgi:ABC-2 type transport system permease protein